MDSVSFEPGGFHLISDKAAQMTTKRNIKRPQSGTVKVIHHSTTKMTSKKTTKQLSSRATKPKCSVRVASGTSKAIAKRMMQAKYDWADLTKPVCVGAGRAVNHAKVDIYNLRSSQEIKAVVYYRAMLNWCQRHHIEIPEDVKDVTLRVQKELKDEEMEVVPDEVDVALTIRDYEEATTGIFWYILTKNESLDKFASSIQHKDDETRPEFDRAKQWCQSEFLPEFQVCVQEELQELLGEKALQGLSVLQQAKSGFGIGQFSVSCLLAVLNWLSSWWKS